MLTTVMIRRTVGKKSSVVPVTTGVHSLRTSSVNMNIVPSLTKRQFPVACFDRPSLSRLFSSDSTPGFKNVALNGNRPTLTACTSVD